MGDSLPREVKYAASLAKKNSDAVGFLPYQAFIEYNELGRLWLQEENGEPCGYLLWGGHYKTAKPRRDPGTLRIPQICIQIDSRRIQHGVALINKLVDLGIDQGFKRISLWCAEDLESNEFWRAMGFDLIGRRKGGQRRSGDGDRVHNHFQLYLPNKDRAGVFDIDQQQGTVHVPTAEEVQKLSRRRCNSVHATRGRHRKKSQVARIDRPNLPDASGGLFSI